MYSLDHNLRDEIIQTLATLQYSDVYDIINQLWKLPPTVYDDINTLVPLTDKNKVASLLFHLAARILCNDIQIHNFQTNINGMALQVDESAINYGKQSMDISDAHPADAAEDLIGWLSQ